MKNKLFFTFLFGLFLLSTSCDKTKTYAEMLKEEKDATNRFIDQNRFVVVEDFPQGDFGQNVYYKTPEGLYMHIISKGTEVNLKTGDYVYIRFKGRLLFKDETTSTNSGDYPWTFLYNNPYSYSGDYFICEGITIPLKYIGDQGKVSLIIPSRLGAYNEKNYVLPVYYKEITYTVNREEVSNN